MILLAFALAFCQTARPAVYQAVARGFPALRALDGGTLAQGSFAQWLENGDELVAVISYDFPDGRKIEERTRLALHPAVAEKSWSWRETKGGAELRRFSVDFAAGHAEAQAVESGAIKRWSKKLKIAPAATFCGFGFTSAIESLLPRLDRDKKLDLKAVVFLPEPKLVSVRVTDQGIDRMEQGGRTLLGRHFRIRAAVPGLARKLLRLPDYHVWLTDPPPAGFLRTEGPLGEPHGPLVRVDLLPGGRSTPAAPVQK